MPAKSKNLPQPPSILGTLGPSFILLGLALGSGELILWPYLAAHYGLGLLWGGLLGISFQFILNTETMRYSLAWGESVFVGFRKLARWIPLWFIISTFIPWSLPGFSSATAQIMVSFFPFLNETWLAIGFLLLVGIILSLGKTLYKTVEQVQKGIIFISLPFILLLTFMFSGATEWRELGWGLIGRGDGWWFFPPGIALASFLGAFAYSGGGGNLNLAQSYYIKEKGFGMGKYTAKIKSLFASGEKKIAVVGSRFVDSTSNRKLWRKWWGLVNLEHFLIFWLLGFLTIVILAILAKALVYGGKVGEGLAFLYTESAMITDRSHALLGNVFLLVAGLMLFSTHLGILESSSRIISENIFLFFSNQKKANLSFGFYIALWLQIGLGVIIYLVGWQEPRFLLTLSAILNAAAMMVAFPLVFWLNKKHLPKAYQPHWWRLLFMLFAFIFFVILVGVTFFS
ncbi:MAG: hypothetical protein A2383_03240 [Candidatus Pacebacteria bacterium RIFOXYB1_FULL_39_46]|nr:MAG: hypothetical protein A2182_01285 [Candidatus Pacebacteria bacterium RIFOXYA1_FULL_38_18]OGJ38432.1 MAG: hypothetical protein A2383_03240 [Candidatus Pacebacteria bacterium RIFOXYB1_FULL_39_46]OGJ40293.1 MAG: hypothetical protein A2411_03385 [Candidatus Pacebacteria bacterium RIFOXYC1_FULL_39_21]OGJ40865.1 MAG: hypothetical protein A2582_02120 [Candidatus Pacebacteria bacterium RIFOXYD1_FULL_39_27]